MKFMLSYMKPYRWLVAASMSLKLVSTVAELLIPYVMEYMIDFVVPARSLELVAFWGVIMLLLAVTVRVAGVTANRLSVRGARNAAYDIRQDLFRHSINLSGSMTDHFGLPSLTSRMTADSYNVQSFLQSGQTLGIRAPFMLVGGICVTMTMDKGLASILAVMAPIMLAVTIFVSIRGIPLFDSVQQSMDEVVRIMRENISGIRVVKALSKEDYESRRFAAASRLMERREITAGVVMALPGPLVTFALNIGLTLVVIVGAIRVNEGRTAPGVILAFLTYFNMILMSVNTFNRIFMTMSKATASARRIQRVVEQPEALPVLTQEECRAQVSGAAACAAQPASAAEPYIIFDHVTFTYNAPSLTVDTHEDLRMALSDISFSMERGSSLGIIGATGSGKTTIINLLMRFYDVTSGRIMIGGRDVRACEREELRKKFGVVFQNDAVFAQPVSQNIRFGRDLDEQQIRTAAAHACADTFIEACPDGYEHEAAAHGANFSGGQKQRILISRALAGRPDILVLDDSSSALDYRTDAQIRRTVRECYEDTTLIVIAQRVSSIMSLDQILVLDEGACIGLGTHSELLESCPVYREIYETQMGEEV